MTVLITGNAHSGTTFLARLLMELGCDFKPVDWVDVPNGMESKVVQQAAHAVTRDLVAGGQLPNFDNQLSPATRKLMAKALRIMPKWTKMPNIGYTFPVWLQAGFRPEHVLVCYRNLNANARSNVRRNVGGLPEMQHRMTGQLGLLAAALWEHDIPYTVIRFPDSVDDAYDLYARLAPVLRDYTSLRGPGSGVVSFASIHSRVAKKGLVHVR